MKGSRSNMLPVFICLLLLAAGADMHASDQEQYEWFAKAETLSRQGRHQQALLYTDSLSTAISDLNEAEQARFHIIRGTAYRFSSLNLQAAQEFQNAIAKVKDGPQKASAHFQLGELYFDEKSFDLALTNYEKALRIFSDLNDHEQKAKAQYKAGIVFKKLEDYPSAIGLFEAVLNSEDSDLMRQALCHDELAHIYYEQANFEQAIEHFEISNDQYRDFDFNSSLVENLRSMALIYRTSKDHVNAIKCLNEAAEICQKNGDLRTAVTCLSELADEHRLSNDPRNAIRAQEKAIGLTPSGNHSLMAEQLVALARVVGETDDDMRAELAFHEAYHYALNNDLNPIAEKSARIESRWQEKRGNIAKAYQRLKSADSLATFNSLSEISSLKRQVSEKRMHSEAYLQDAKDARTQMEQERDSNFWNIIIIGVVSFAIIFIFFARDLAQKKKLSKVLKWKVYKRTRELRKANKELNTYIYKSSHDLRTPLTSIKSLIRLLDKEEHNASTKKYLGLISSCTDQMDDILVNLSRAVDFKKVDVKVEAIDFNKIKYELEARDFAPATGLDIKWEINQAMPFYSDYKLLKVILKRTIKNAVDYRKGSNLDFCKILINTDTDGAIVSIEDNGQGVSDKVKDNIFDMFVKGTNKSKGAGLGLYLVKIACDKIKGKVHLENNQHSGATLIFKLPNLEQPTV